MTDGSGAPVLVELQAAGAGLDLLAERLGQAAVALAQTPTLIGRPSNAWSIRMMFHGPGVQVVAHVPVADPVPPPIRVVMPDGDGRLDLLRADEVDMRVHAAGRDDLALGRDDLRARPDHQPRIDAVLGERIAGLAHGHDPALANPDVALDDPPVVDDHRVRDHQVAVVRAHRLLERALILAVPDRLASPEDRLLAVVGVVVLDLDDQLAVGQPDAVADGRPVLLGVGLPRDFDAHELMSLSSRRVEPVLGSGTATVTWTTCGRISGRRIASGWFRG